MSQIINGPESKLTDWNFINWKKVRRNVMNLQRRIFRARKLGQWKQLRRLQKLLLRSFSNLLLCIRQITQTNAGKSTAGVDKEVITTPEQRVKLANKWVLPKASPTRRVYIPKSNGKKRCDPADGAYKLPRQPRQTAPQVSSEARMRTKTTSFRDSHRKR